MTVLIAGGGVAGLALALTCHEIGIDFKVFDAVRVLKPLGVGINLQPTAVRELFDLGLEAQLEKIGIRTRDYGLYTQHGLHIWTEDRGTWAGYDWPQYSVHRGALHMMLYEEVIRRAGPTSVQTGWSATGFFNEHDHAVLHLTSADGDARLERGAVVVGADGIHSAIRAQMQPDEGPPIWGGTILWRGTTRAAPFRSGASMVLIGPAPLRFVAYPISKPDPKSGHTTINWLASLNFDADAAYRKEDWNRRANLADFLPRFEGMQFAWLDVPALIRGAEEVFEYPMVDRDPLDSWTQGRVSLMGDAAHAAYPVGSNGAGAAILDARVLGAAFLAHGVGPAALQAYEDKMRPITSSVVLTNRKAGPDRIIDEVEARSTAQTNHVEQVMTPKELADHAANYRAIAGTGVASTNAQPRTIPKGARL